MSGCAVPPWRLAQWRDQSPRSEGSLSGCCCCVGCCPAGVYPASLSSRSTHASFHSGRVTRISTWLALTQSREALGQSSPTMTGHTLSYTSWTRLPTPGKNDNSSSTVQALSRRWEHGTLFVSEKASQGKPRPTRCTGGICNRNPCKEGDSSMATSMAIGSMEGLVCGARRFLVWAASSMVMARLVSAKPALFKFHGSWLASAPLPTHFAHSFLP